MLFNSYEFILIFLPITLIGFFKIAKYNTSKAILWLVISSLVFYGIWFPENLIILLFSVIINFLLSYLILKNVLNKKVILISGILFNLSFLGFFKYFNFFVNSVLFLEGQNLTLENITLPLGISFFTFTQIAYLVDVYSGKVREYKIDRYFLFVTYFPHLIAGPLIHHSQMIPQFLSKRIFTFNSILFSKGLTFFIIGLSKKLLVADNLAIYADAVFNAANQNIQTDFIESWTGSLAYTFQIYFDFSGYSDMAIGLSLMFGIKLPINFNSPYKAKNIINFWKCWHITLSNFLKHYLYFPLGGNKKGDISRFCNILITMILGGLWHGASWNFIFWGGLHGCFIITNHFWITNILNNFNFTKKMKKLKIYNFFAITITFICVVIAWIFFRAENFSSALLILKGCFGFAGVSLPSSFEILMKENISFIEIFDKNIFYNGIFINIPDLASVGGPFSAIFYLSLSIFLVWGFPNSQEILQYREYKKNVNLPISKYKKWYPNIFYAIISSILFCFCFGSIEKISPFLYYQF